MMKSGYNTTLYGDTCITTVKSRNIQYEDIAVISMLSIFSVIGTIGNGLVIYVYSRKKDKLTSNLFIMALAITDFITSLLIMPYTVVFLYIEGEVEYDPLCKIYHFLITSTVPLSAFIMVSIGVDRYLCICHPFLHLLTIRRAKIILLLQLAFAAILGLITSLMFSVYHLPNELNILFGLINTTANFQHCEYVYTGRCEHTIALYTNDFTDYYQKVYSSFFLISLLLVFTLYIMIYHFVTSRRAKREKQKHSKQFSTTMVQTDNSQIQLNEHGHSTKVEVNQNGVCTSLMPPSVDGDGHSTTKRRSTREKRDHNSLANIKTALMLFVVAVVFIIAFLPAWLMALKIVDYVQIVFYSYFIYNVVNPIIYAFMNQTFRKDLKKVFGTCVKSK